MAHLTAPLKAVARHLPHRLVIRIVLWPVFCSLLIVIAGSLYLWNQTSTTVMSGRERVFGMLADSAKRDLEQRVAVLEDDLHLWSVRWFDVGGLEPAQRSSGYLMDWAFSYRRDQQKVYELVLFVGRDGFTKHATSPHATRAELKNFENIPAEQLLQLPVGWLAPVLEKGVAAAQSPRPIERINRFRERPLQAANAVELPSHYQLVVAYPARSADNSKPEIGGAVIAVASWSVFQEELDKFKKYSSDIGFSSGYAFLVNTETDRVIGHDARDPNGDNVYDTHLRLDHNLADLAEALRSNAPGIFHYEFRGARKFAALSKVRPLAVLGWGLGVAVNEQEILREVQRLTSLYGIFGALATTAVLLATTLVARRLSLSVRELIRVARDAGGASVAAGHSSDDEIAELQEAVNELAARHQQSKSFVPLNNPYVVGTPIHRASMFFGRTDDVKWIQDHLRQPGNELILLTGQRRIGKTSLLRHVQRLHSELKVIPFFIDTQSLIPSVTDDVSFYRALLDEMLGQLKDAAPNVPAPTLVDIPERDAIWKLLKYLNHQCAGAVPVLLIDELENFEHRFRTGTLTPDVLSFFAGLLDSTRTVSFIATGSDRLERRRAKYWNALLIKSVRRHIGVLSRRDALRIVTEPLAGKLVYSPDVPKSILRLTGEHPYYTQDICQRLVNELNARRTNLADDKVLAEIVSQTLKNPPPTLDYVWDKSLRVQGRVFLSVLASSLGDDQVRLTVQEVVDRASATLKPQLVASKSRLSATVAELMNGDWLDDYNGHVRFKVDLLRLWLQREHPPSNVEIEVRYPAILEAQYDA